MQNGAVRRPASAAALLLSLAAAAGGLAGADDCPPLFVVERSSNANVVVYEAPRAPGGVVDPKRPVRGHWRMWAEDGRREELNFVERRLAYGVDVLGPTPGGGVEIALKALPERRIEVRRDGPCPAALTALGGQEALLRRAFVQIASGGLIPKVAYLELHGEDAATREARVERIEIDGPRSSAGAPASD